MTNFPLTLTSEAADKARMLIQQSGRDDLRLRISVQPGGCAGLKYQLGFSLETFEGDSIEDFDGLEVVIDKMSFPYLDGATISYEDTIEKQGFNIDNPNASSSCACGDSFN